jgi:hypothetical protein
MAAPLVDMSGRGVEDRPDLASGIYLYTDQAMADMAANGTLNCPTRAGFLHIRGVDRIETCNGRTTIEQLPDMHIVNWRYRPILTVALALMCIALMVGIIRNVA